MKKLLFIALLLMIVSVQAQDVETSYEKFGDMVKVTNFYEDGSVKEQGFYKNKIVTGTWITYDRSGNKTTVAKYKNGKKVGKWLIWTNDGVKEVNYENNTIASVEARQEVPKIAIK